MVPQQHHWRISNNEKNIARVAIENARTREYSSIGISKNEDSVY